MLPPSRLPCYEECMDRFKLIKARIPFALRVEGHRLLRGLRDLPLRGRMATGRGRVQDFTATLAAGASPVERVPGALPARLQRGKERNLALAVAAVDGLRVEPGQLFSYHRCVGRPSRLRGFAPGLELRQGVESEGAGGGLCQLSNLLYLLAIRAKLRIVERHRHGLDLFPDHARSVPFGCGATVFYNYRDLRFENCLDQPLLLRLELADGELRGRILARQEPGYSVEILERDHRFFEENGQRMRENRILRRVEYADGRVEEEELAHNRCRVVY